MKKTLAVAATAAIAAGAVGATAATKTNDVTHRCVVNDSSTLVANGDVRVYTIHKGFGDNAQRTGIYACRFNTGRKVALGTAYVRDDENEDRGPIRYIRDITPSVDLNDPDSPPVVAYVDTNCIKDPCTNEIVVKSLQNGKTLRRFKAGSPFDYVEVSFPTDQDGYALAWLETSAGGTCEQGCRVHLIKNSGDRVLDEGSDINSDRFAVLDTDRWGIITSLGSNEFVWERGGTMKVASFND